ncbi:DNA polymerase III subunit gamma/tau [Rubrivivax gelatinosus]|uniref:DNA polymerase III subunit gamma/tau n=1 Tax=Rubrivivax gelatinosus TaxID=28068 RepID=UPI00104B7DF3|nr:DNA polymerase III subunit gamma/tau [Rubrivivax gelatinosus]MBK1685995.1 DNA polymerase III, subunit gamma and tau [Rubrivivax gelatinosus]
MSYVVLARKYRPRSFDQMVGQEHVVRALSNALEQQRLHHAYLFTGTRGIGKTTVSRILAKSLNCTGPDGTGGITAHPCGVCSACTEIDADRYIDYIELDAASNRSIDEIRDLIERAAYKPGIGRFKVFMIDEAHQLTKDAFNALLKTLEEPPEYLKFVLATTDPEKMLPTVLSRCLQFNLRPMAPQTVHDHLQKVLAAEHVPHDEASLRLLSRAARGSMRDALSLTDQAIAYGGGRVDEAVVRGMLGSVDRGHARRLVEALAARDGAAVLATVDALRAMGLSAAATLEELASLLQQMAVEQAVPGALDVQDPDTEDARALAGVLAPDETQLLYSIALHGRAELALMSDEYGALTMVLLRLLAFPPAGAAPLPPREAPRSAPLRAPSPPAMTMPVAKAAAPVAAPQPAPAAPVAAPPTAAPASRPTAAPVVERRPEAPVPAPVPQAAPERATKRAASHDDDGPPWDPDDEPPLEGEFRHAVAAPSRRPAEVPEPERFEPAPVDAVPDEPQPVERRPRPVRRDEPPAPPPRTPLGDRWYALCQTMAERGAVSALLRELAWQGGLVEVDEAAAPPRWRLQVERESLRTNALREKLAAAMAAELGAPVELVLEPGSPEDTPARRDAWERTRRQQEAEHTIRHDPVVLELMRQFPTARLVPNSIKPI